MIIRQATTEDHLQLANLRWQHESDLRDLTGFSKDEFIEQVYRFLDSDDGKGFTVSVAEEQGNIIANVFVKLIRKVPKPHCLYSRIGYVTNVQTIQA